MKRKRRSVKSSRKDFESKFSFVSNHRWILYPVYALAAVIIIAVVSILILSRNLPSLIELERAGDPYLMTRIYSADGKVLKELSIQKDGTSRGILLLNLYVGYLLPH